MPNLTPEQVRAKVLEDPNTAKIAAELKVSLEEYVQRVIFFATNPGAEPELFIMRDEDVVANGGTVPDIADAVRVIDQQYELVNGTQVSRFESKAGGIPAPPAAQVEPGQVKTELQSDIAQKIRRPTKI